MTDKQIKKYCDGLDCAICDEKEPCIYKIANELEEKLLTKEKECNELKSKLAKSFADERKKEIKIDQLKQALKEIKEITEDTKTKVFVDMEDFWEQILQKISECEVENDNA